MLSGAGACLTFWLCAGTSTILWGRWADKATQITSAAIEPSSKTRSKAIFLFLFRGVLKCILASRVWQITSGIAVFVEVSGALVGRCSKSSEVWIAPTRENDRHRISPDEFG